MSCFGADDIGSVNEDKIQMAWIRLDENADENTKISLSRHYARGRRF